MKPSLTAEAPGFHRGGNGLRMGYRFLEPGEISIHDDRWLTYPWGVNGGLPGRRSEKILNRVNGKVEKLPSKCDRIKVDAGDLLYFDTWGGGGCGDPLQRPAERVAFDVKAGLVTKKGARRYGVVLNNKNEVNEKATETLRAKMAKARRKVKMFDFGGTVNELKKVCKRETGLEPPRPPEFQTWVTAGMKDTKKKKKKTTKRKTKKTAAKKTKKKTTKKRKAA